MLTYTRSVNVFLRWAHKEGEVGEVKAAQPKVSKKLVDVLSRDEIDQLEGATRDERDKLIVRLLADTGMRVGELIGLRIGDLTERMSNDRERQHYLHVTGKGQRDRLVPLTPKLNRRLQKYIEHSRPRDARSQYVFLAHRRHDGDYEPLTRFGVHQLITTLTGLAGIKKRVYPHLLRHSYATWALQQGMGPLQLAQILGHSSLAMIFSVYAHLSPQDAHAAAMSVFLVKDDDRR